MPRGKAPQIIAIVGEKSSGKSVVFRYLRRKPGIAAVRFSNVINATMRPLGLDTSDRSVQGKLAEILRYGFGGGVLVRPLLEQAIKQKKKFVVLEGLRKLSEWEALKKYPRVTVVYIHAPVATRWQWATRRAERVDDRVSLAKFIHHEKILPAEKEIPAVGRRADVRVENTGTKRQLFMQMNAVLSTLGYRPSGH